MASEMIHSLDCSNRTEILETYPIEEFNRDLKDGAPTVDIAVHIVSGSFVTWEAMRPQILAAKKAFGAHGLQVRLLGARKIRAPEDWLRLSATVMTGDTSQPELSERDLYAYLEMIRYALSERALQVFEGVLRGITERGESLQVVCLREVSFPMHMRDPKEADRWRIEETLTSGLSFPPYILENRVPDRFKGVITLSPRAGGFGQPKVLAHEMGHKLINVSHEGVGVCPVARPPRDDAPDLMLYGPGIEIPSGREGRWHAERLALSPFIYRKVGGVKVFNPGYRERGRYGDPLYGGYAIYPSCPAEPSKV